MVSSEDIVRSDAKMEDVQIEVNLENEMGKLNLFASFAVCCGRLRKFEGKFYKKI